MHNHADAYGDNGTGTIAENLDYMMNNATPSFDFGGLSPHSHMVTSPDMLTYWAEMDAMTNSTFVAVPGQEWSTLSTSNHVNVYLGNERCGVPNGDIPGFYNWLNTSQGYGSFNHPWSSGGSDMNNWEYYPWQDKPGNYSGKMVMMEMKLAAGDGSGFMDYIEALDNGWHIGISVNDDDHGGTPGDKYVNNPRTGMWLDDLTPNSVEMAFRELRFFGSQLEDGYIDLRVDNYTMGDIFAGSNGMELYARLNPNFNYSSVDIYINGTAYAMTQMNTSHYSYTIPAAEDHYYFVRAREDVTGAYIISSPMWSTIGGAGPPPAQATDVNAQLEGADVNITWQPSSDDVPGNYQASLLPTDDSHVAEGYPDTNYGSSTAIYIQSENTGSYLSERGWFKFDLNGQLPGDAVITSVSLELYCWLANGLNMFADCVSSSNDSWTETDVTWNAQPVIESVLDTQWLTVGVTYIWYSWNVTSFIEGEWSGDGIASLVVKPTWENSGITQTYAFESKEWSNALLRPRLVINYSSAESGITYDVYRGSVYDPLGVGYSYLDTMPSGSTSYIDSGVGGDGDMNDYFYYVRAANLAGGYINSSTQAGKVFTDIGVGWNLVSTPLAVQDTSLATVLQTVIWDYVQYYTGGQWKSNSIYRPDPLDDLDTMNRSMAVWVNSFSVDRFITAGQVVNTSIPLYSGWNFVGYPAFTDKTVADALAGTGFDAVEGFNIARPYHLEPLLDTDMMRTGRGYWVHVPIDSVWVVDW